MDMLKGPKMLYLSGILDCNFVSAMRNEWSNNL